MRPSSIGHVDHTPFTTRHLDAAAALLAARHRGDRTREPQLPARFEALGEAHTLLERISQRSGASGVVAIRRGRVVGYLIGYLISTPLTSYGAASIATRAGFIGYAGHAVDVADAIDVVGALYGALAADWVDAGCLSHYVLVPTDVRIEQCWHTLGFGRAIVTAMRATDALGSADWPGEIRRGRPEDLDTVVGFMNGLHQFEEAAPMWRPYVPESEAEARAFQAQMLDDPACVHWIASQDGRPVAMQSFQPPPWFLSPLLVPEQSVYLMHAYTEPAARGQGVGTTLLASALAWAREAGYKCCLVDFTAANLLASRFWLGHGFRPIAYRLCHRLDERLMSPRSRGRS